MRTWLSAAWLLSALVGQAAAGEPVLNVGAMPNQSTGCTTLYQRFLIGNLDRAFAVGHGEKACGYQAGVGSAEQAEAKALEFCGGAKAGCAIYARGLDVVWPGHAPRPRSLPAAIEGDGWELHADPTFFAQGVGTAPGVVLYAHGRNAQHDNRDTSVFSLARFFNNVGWDVWRFDRDLARDGNYAWSLASNRIVVDHLRAMGYRRIVIMGHSRGGWQGLDLAGNAGLVDAVVAIAPARHGARGSPTATVETKQIPDYRQLLTRIAPGTTRIAIMTFAEDLYDADPVLRGQMARTMLGEKNIPYLVIAAPEGFKGHSAARDYRFNQRYGACLYRFVTSDSPKPTECPGTEDFASVR